MAINNNKPDLADLKARLGLKKDEQSTSVKGEGSQPGATANNQSVVHDDDETRPITLRRDEVAQLHQEVSAASAQPRPGSSTMPPPPAGKAPTMPPPPAAKSNPPPTAPPAVHRTMNTTNSSPDNREPVDFDGQDELALPGGRMFSNTILILLGLVMGVGLFFGYLTATSLQERGLYNGRTEDAATIRDVLKPRVESLAEVNQTLNNMDVATVDFEATEALSSYDFVPPGNLFAHYRLLLGIELVEFVTRYMADATILKRMIDDHIRITTQMDREDIEYFVKENKILEKENFAVVFDFRDLIRRGGDDGYEPKVGRLATVENFERDKDGNIRVQYLNASRASHTEIQGVVPVSKSDLIRSAGTDNAVERYGKRIQAIRAHIERMDQYVPRMMSGLNEVADRGGAALIYVSEAE